MVGIESPSIRRTQSDTLHSTCAQNSFVNLAKIKHEWYKNKLNNYSILKRVI